MEQGDYKSLEDPRSTSTSPPYSEDPQSEWDLGCPYTEDLGYTSIWNPSNPTPISVRDDPTSERVVLCTICHKNLVPVQEVLLVGRKKRKRQEDLPVLSSMTVCEDCRALPAEQLRSISVPEKSKRVVKRQRAKNRTMENEGAALVSQREKQLQELEKNPDLPETEKRRLQQMVRNRISAQQSRDRKKVYLLQMESANDELKLENDQLRDRIKSLEQENQYLRDQLERYMTEPSSSGTKWAGGMLLGLTAVMMVVMVTMQSPAGSDGVQLQRRALNEVTSVVKYQSAVSAVPVMPPTLLYEDTYPVTLREIRQQAVDRYMDLQSRFLPDAPSDPCSAEMILDLQQHPDQLTTMYCPHVQMHWGSDNSAELNYIQILTPADSLPLSFKDKIPQGNYLMELICKVTDVRLIHNEA